MTESDKYIRAMLENRTNAECSSSEVKNNRFHYHLRFEESIGWDWVSEQITKVCKNLEVDIELWKINPSGVGDFEIEVRELSQRKDIDENQRGLDYFES